MSLRLRKQECLAQAHPGATKRESSRSWPAAGLGGGSRPCAGVGVYRVGGVVRRSVPGLGSYCFAWRYRRKSLEPHGRRAGLRWRLSTGSPIGRLPTQSQIVEHVDARTSATCSRRRSAARQCPRGSPSCCRTPGSVTQRWKASSTAHLLTRRSALLESGADRCGSSAPACTSLQGDSRCSASSAVRAAARRASKGGHRRSPSSRRPAWKTLVSLLGEEAALSPASQLGPLRPATCARA